MFKSNIHEILKKQSLNITILRHTYTPNSSRQNGHVIISYVLSILLHKLLVKYALKVTKKDFNRVSLNHHPNSNKDTTIKQHTI